MLQVMQEAVPSSPHFSAPASLPLRRSLRSYRLSGKAYDYQKDSAALTLQAAAHSFHMLFQHSKALHNY
jgi:hypothetical protein